MQQIEVGSRYEPVFSGIDSHGGYLMKLGEKAIYYFLEYIQNEWLHDVSMKRESLLFLLMLI